MPMDGVMLGFVARQLDTVLRDGRVDRVIQPEKDEIHLLIRAQGGNHRLVLSAAASAARVHLSEYAKTGPMEPPMFCMLLRKYLCGGRVLAVRRIAGDRILEIDISNLSELGDPVTRTMVVEIMGRHSNIILRAADGRIVDAARHVGQDISRVRQVLPGLTYAYPPAQGKLNPETATAEEIALRLAQEGGKLEKAIGACVAGFSPQAAREAAARIGMNGSSLVSEIDVQAAAGALHGYLREMPSLSPCVVTLDDAGTPTDVFPFPQVHLPTAQTAQYADPSAALDAYFYERDRRDRLNQRSASLAHALKNHIERCEKKIAIQNEALEGAARMEEYRQNGELLQANLYRLQKGEPTAVVENYYSENCEPVSIPMDVSLSPAQNAQRYFKLYQKARGARTLAAEQKEKAEQDVDAFHPTNVGRIMLGDYRFLPCTPAGIMELICEYGIDPTGKECVVVGRSDIVGKPMAMLLLHANGTVTVCHSKTKNLAKITRRADILVMAIGKADFLKGDMIKDGAVVIDVGMNRKPDGKLTGDVDFAECEPKASFITPVPGGVGPMTITMLMKNTLAAAKAFADAAKA